MNGTFSTEKLAGVENIDLTLTCELEMSFETHSKLINFEVGLKYNVNSVSSFYFSILVSKCCYSPRNDIE